MDIALLHKIFVILIFVSIALYGFLHSYITSADKNRKLNKVDIFVLATSSIFLLLFGGYGLYIGIICESQYVVPITIISVAYLITATRLLGALLEANFRNTN